LGDEGRASKRFYKETILELFNMVGRRKRGNCLLSKRNAGKNRTNHGAEDLCGGGQSSLVKIRSERGGLNKGGGLPARVRLGNRTKPGKNVNTTGSSGSKKKRNILMLRKGEAILMKQIGRTGTGREQRTIRIQANPNVRRACGRIGD